MDGKRAVWAMPARPAPLNIGLWKQDIGRFFKELIGWWMLFPRPFNAGKGKVPKTISRDFETITLLKFDFS